MCIAIFLLVAVTAYSQDTDEKFLIGVSPEISWATGLLKNTTSIGLGGYNICQFAITQKARITATFGGVTYRGREYKTAYGTPNDYNDYVFLQVSTGFKYFYFRGLFAQVQGGFSYSIAKETLRGWGVYYAPVAGFEFAQGHNAIPYGWIIMHSKAKT